MKFKRLFAVGLAGAAVLVLGVLLPSAANAETINGCPEKKFCAWVDTMYSGRIQIDQPDANAPAIYLDFGVSSYWNRTGQIMCAYNKVAGVLTINPGEQTAYLDGGWNDSITLVFPGVPTC